MKVARSTDARRSTATSGLTRRSVVGTGAPHGGCRLRRTMPPATENAALLANPSRCGTFSPAAYKHLSERCVESCERLIGFVPALVNLANRYRSSRVEMRVGACQCKRQTVRGSRHLRVRTAKERLDFASCSEEFADRRLVLGHRARRRMTVGLREPPQLRNRVPSRRPECCSGLADALPKDIAPFAAPAAE